jgi:hypothetical protein
MIGRARGRARLVDTVCLCALTRVCATVGRSNRLGMALIALFCAFLAVDVVGATSLKTASGANTVTFSDAVGEDSAGPDITSVVVSADRERRLAFRIVVPNRPTLTEDMRIRIWIDADDNLSTGLAVQDRPELRGIDYFVLVDRWELGLSSARVFECKSSTCSGKREVGFSYFNGGAFDINAADIGISHRQRLRFRVETSSGWLFDPSKGYDATNVHVDAAPDDGRYWRFDMRPLLVTSFNTTPVTAHAGSRYALRMSLVRTATGKPARGKVACSFKVDGLSLRLRTSGFRAGSAVCAFVIPPDAKGKRYRGSIAVLVAGERLVRAAAGTVR